MSGQQTTGNQSIVNRENAVPAVDLRDYFAAAALQGMLGGLDRNTMRFLENTENPSGKMASAAYNIADAMLKAREVKP